MNIVDGQFDDNTSAGPLDVSFRTEHNATRFLKLPHPRTGASSLSTPLHNENKAQLICELRDTTGAPALFLPASKAASDGNVQLLLEVQAVNATGDKQRSWFTSDDKVIGGKTDMLIDDLATI